MRARGVRHRRSCPVFRQFANIRSRHSRRLGRGERRLAGLVWINSPMIALDLSRLLSRAGRGTPTGIDRVELAYAEHLIAADPSARFAATTPLGGLGLVPRDRAEGFVAAIAAAWRGKPEAIGEERHVRRLA